MILKKINRKLHSFVHNPRILIRRIWELLEPFVSDEFFLRVLFFIKVGYWPNLKSPKSFNEKINWLKLHYKKPEYTKMVDKVAAKEYVASIIGDQYIIPTLGVWNKVEDIEWDSLPSQFVIKASHDSGGVVVCRDKNNLNVEEAIDLLKGKGKVDYTRYSKEYVYHDVPHRYIAEMYMEDESGYELKDYKIFCFDGTPKFLFVATGRQQHDTRFDFFDENFKHLPVLNGHLNATVCPLEPKNFEEMLEIAKQLSKGMPHVRVDLYNINGKIYFGELTFFHWSGLTPFEPRDWDYKFGDYLHLPKIESI